MYHADQYVAPEGQYTTVHAVDGTAWYKQYAVDAGDKSPCLLYTSGNGRRKAVIISPSKASREIALRVGIYKEYLLTE